MRKRVCVVAVCLSYASAQPPPDLGNRIASLRYPPLAEQARIQGEVSFVVRQNVPADLKGHPLLVYDANRSWEALKIVAPDGFMVRFHYILDQEPVIRHTKHQTPRGNGFDRLWLRLFHQPTTRAEEKWDCDDRGPHQPSTVQFDQQGLPVEITLHGKMVCRQTIAD